MRRAAAIAAFALVGCKDPTEVTIEVTTDVPCTGTTGVRATNVVVGLLGDGGIEDRPPSSTQTRCADGYVGTLVVVPSGAKDDPIAFKVTTGLGKSPDDCPAAGGPGCIVARRALRFLPSTKLEVPIVMRGRCEGVVCDPTSTCVKGACVPATIPDPSTCASPGGCGEELLAPSDAGAGDATVDAALDASASGDAASRDAGDAAVPVAACGDMSGLQANAPMPMDGYCPAKRRKSPYAGPSPTPKPTLKWSRKRAANPEFPPLIAADGTIYMASDDSSLYAFDRAGNQVGRFAAPEQIQWCPAIGADGNIYVPGVTQIFQVSLTPVGGILSAKPSPFPYGARGNLTFGAGPTLFFDDGSSTLYALDTAGVERWHATFAGPVDYMSPAIGADSFVYQFVANGQLQKIAPADGGASLVRTLGASTSGAVAIAPDGNVRVARREGMGLDSVSPGGALAWSFSLADAGAGQAGDVAIGDDSTAYVGTQTSPVIAVGANGVRKWTAQSGGNDCLTATLDANEVVYAGCNDTLYAFDAQNGSVLWSVPLTPGTASIYSISIGADHVVYVHSGTGLGTTDGTLHAVGN